MFFALVWFLCVMAFQPYVTWYGRSKWLKEFLGKEREKKKLEENADIESTVSQVKALVVC